MICSTSVSTMWSSLALTFATWSCSLKRTFRATMNLDFRSRATYTDPNLPLPRARPMSKSASCHFVLLKTITHEKLELRLQRASNLVRDSDSLVPRAFAGLVFFRGAVGHCRRILRLRRGRWTWSQFMIVELSSRKLTNKGSCLFAHEGATATRSRSMADERKHRRIHRTRELVCSEQVIPPDRSPMTIKGNL